MGLHVRYEIRCDHCPEMDSVNWSVAKHRYSITAFRDDMRKQGWTIGKTICCPLCMGKGRRKPPVIVCAKQPWQNLET